MTAQPSDLLRQFEAQKIDPDKFGHREHVQVAFEMLHLYDYLDACATYASTINTIATEAGAPEKFNVTITFAFLSLIADRINTFPSEDFELFLEQNTDLLSPTALEKWYSREELSSDFARRHFMLPRVA